jgi:hypothetical protein
MALTKYEYTKDANIDLLSLEIQQTVAITIALDHIDANATALSIWFREALSTGEKTELDTVVANHVRISTPPDAIPVLSTSDLVTSWTHLKSFYASTLGTSINYIDLGEHYYIWLCFRNIKFYQPHLDKNSAEGVDFETNYKHKSNVPQASEVRLSTCRYGRKLHSRYITFFTAEPDGFDNNNYLEQNHGDAIYTMIDVDRNVTTDKSLCKETWVDWEPSYSYEVAGGGIFIPATFAGDNDDAWELHVVGAPDYPAQYGGSIEFISNPRLKWKKGDFILEDESLNPAAIDYVPGYHFTKIRWIVKHPLGASSEFQIHMRIFR